MSLSSANESLKREIRPAAMRDANDPPRFSQLVEAAKNVFLDELREFFDQQRSAGRISEVPTLEKYSAPQGRADNDDPYETAINLIRTFPDLLQNLPLVAITSASANERKPSFTGNFVSHVQAPCRVTGQAAEPYLGLFPGGALETLTIETEDKLGNPRVSSFSFSAGMFADPSSITVREFACAINNQSLYVEAHRIERKLTNVYEEPILQISVGGPRGHVRPNHITVLGGTAPLLSALGLTIGQTDNSDNPERPAGNRYMIAADMSIGFDIGAESDNERTELTDLMWNFGALHFDKRQHTILGRGFFDERYPLENTQIIIKGSMSSSGEADVPRPEGDVEDKIYVNRFTLPVTVLSYVDRLITDPVIPSVLNFVDVTNSAEGAINVPFRT